MNKIDNNWRDFDRIYQRPNFSSAQVVSGDITSKAYKITESKSFSTMKPCFDSSSSSLLSKVASLFSSFINWIQGYTKITCEVPVKSNPSQTGFYDFYVKKSELLQGADKKVQNVFKEIFEDPKSRSSTVSYASSASVSTNPSAFNTPSSSPSSTPRSAFRSPASSEETPLLEEFFSKDIDRAVALSHERKKLVEEIENDKLPAMFIFPKMLLAEQKYERAQSDQEPLCIINELRITFKALETLYRREKDFEDFQSKLPFRASR